MNPKRLSQSKVSQTLSMHSCSDSPNNRESSKNAVDTCPFPLRVAKTGLRSLVNFLVLMKVRLGKHYIHISVPFI